MIDIIDVPDGQIIDKPGLYRMSMAWYHSQCCAGPSVSSSGLRTVITESPYHFWMQSDLNPDRFPEKEPSDALILGRAAHALILGDEVFDDHFIYVPADAPRRPTAAQVAAFERNGKWSEAAAPGAAFWEDFDARADGRMMLTDTQVEHIRHMAEAINANPEAHQVLVSPFTEISMIWQDVTGLWVKSRPDTIPTNGADFGDLKTFSPRSKNIKRAVHQAITDHRYDMQLALAVTGAEQTMGRTASDCALVMAQVGVPYTVTPVRIDAEALYWAKVMNRHALDLIAKGLETGHWPQPVEGFLDYSLPDSITARYAELQGDGELPNVEY